MNLLEMLGGSLTQKESVDNIAKKSKSSNAQILKLVALWLPLLMTYLTRNAKKEGGAKSLANALGQHRNTNDLASQIKDADTEDGEKILKHILGNDEDQVTKNLARQAGMDQSQVKSALDAMLPGIMSGISSSASQASKKQKSGVDLSDGMDLTDVMGMFGGSTGKSSGMGLEGLLGGVLGMNKAKKTADTKKKTSSSGSSVSKAELEKAKYEAEIAKANAEKAKAEAELAKIKAEQARSENAAGTSKKPSSSKTKKQAVGNSAIEGLMGQLLGGTAKEAPSKKSTMDGTDLIKMLAGMM